MSSHLKTLLFICLPLIGTLGARTVEELKVAYEVKMLEVVKEYREDLEKLANGYAGALDKVQKKLQKGGRLDDVLQVVGEKKEVKAGKWPLGRLDPSAPAELIRVRKIYETSRIRAERDHAGTVIETAERMEELLEKQMKSWTRAGKIGEAKKARDLLETIRNDPGIKASQELVKRVKLNQEAPVAHHIRRSGDHLEVLVRFDKSGKVSFDSPVENVVEITGGRGEKGETKAKVLGEFVGAKGYEVDSFVSYQSDMDKIVPPLRASGFQLEARTEYEGRRALRVLLPNKVENPRVEWPNVLPPIGSSSYVRIDFQYFIPSENKNVREFDLHWGFGALIEKKRHQTRGRWVSESLESESLNELDTLRIYAAGMPAVNGIINGGNEAIYLDDMKITFLTFAAHVVADYREGKVDGKVIENPAAQKAIILAGKFPKSQ